MTDVHLVFPGTEDAFLQVGKSSYSIVAPATLPNAQALVISNTVGGNWSQTSAQNNYPSAVTGSDFRYVTSTAGTIA